MVTLILVGIALLALETVVPGGFFGLAGILSLLGALYLGLGATVGAAVAVGVVTCVGLLCLYLLVKVFPHSDMGKALTLHFSYKKEDGYESAKEKSHMLGKEGVAHSVLRPAGVAIIDGNYVDVVTEGTFYEAGTKVRVVEVQGGRVVVRAVEA